MCTRRGRALLLLIGLVAAMQASAQDGGRCVAPATEAAEPASDAEAALQRGNESLQAGDPDAARTAYTESERLAEAAGDARVAAFARASAIRADVDSGRTADAEARLAAVVTSSETLGPAARSALLLHVARSEVLLAERDPLAASAARRRAARLLARAARGANEAGDARLESYAQGNLGRLYEDDGRFAEARTLTRRALVLASRAEALDAVYRWQWQLGRIERAEGNAASALAALRSAVVVLDSVRAELTLGSARTALAFRTEVEPVYRDLVDLLIVTARSNAANAQSLLREARDTLEASKVAQLREYFRDPCLASQRVAALETVPGTVVVYPVVLPDRLELIVGVGDRLVSLPVDVDGASFVAEVRALRRFLVKRTTREYREPATRLHDWLVRPLVPLLADLDAPPTLVFVPSGPLLTVPMAALRDRESGRFLVEQYPLAMTPGLTLTEPRAVRAGESALLAAGLTQAVQGYPSLDFAAAELDAIAAVFPGEQLVDQGFVTPRFEQSVAERPFGIVHIASHGEFSRVASESFVLTWDGKLPMDELASIVASTRFRTTTPLELLTLSACETAAGDDLAALGLAGVALRAGARSALATLWAVHDQTSMQLVTRFYGHLAEPGMTRARALALAQRELLAQRATRHPVYWSAFVLIGSWL